MNKQELIERFEQFSGHGSRCYIERNEILNLVKQLDEPQPVKVPQFVAEIIEYYKRHNATLYDALREKNFNKQYNEWLMNEQDAYNKVARAWLDGYEVEKEKRYRVKFKGFNSSYIILKHHHYDNTWFLGGEQEYEFYRTKHTRKQLEEAGFGWVFNCEGIEIEEVE